MCTDKIFFSEEIKKTFSIISKYKNIFICLYLYCFKNKVQKCYVYMSTKLYYHTTKNYSNIT
ncbi:hypothetical protein PFAG_02662 [Plasmodium falciparum Santa Lucia]|uniref:Uncharacterized protein n=3 Tax=Plasmodium falciparum TaxID=5833 RepID=W4J537_PLAFP|nr:hypothetical protein PFUGPA_01212 [Plasmodium falciparum Palo Alto/Uganda]EUR72088.1 hypothetical protein PFBG_02755 [Plasmodium falciparum 7G8]EUT84807.1 hypothetical protein PFAG_03101 [Plasmodium falciparum Santa Lucia]EUT85954.1 hypothetical protein PFAG_02662 [Plasmodium falciparum Santa Lucia]